MKRKPFNYISQLKGCIKHEAALWQEKRSLQADVNKEDFKAAEKKTLANIKWGRKSSNMYIYTAFWKAAGSF